MPAQNSRDITDAQWQQSTPWSAFRTSPNETFLEKQYDVIRFRRPSVGPGIAAPGFEQTVGA